MSGKSRKLSIDRLSSLPDEVICHILSFLPTKLSVSTCVLAKRWRFLWAHVPIWDFEGDFFRNRTTNTDLIYRVILWHKAKTLHALRLRSIQCNEYQLETLIITAIDRKIRNLFLDFDVPKFIKLCRPLFNCKTVVDMRLGNCKGFSSTGDICLPSLKKLHLSKVGYKDDEALSHLLSGCPLLQELILDCDNPYSNGKTLKISSSTIKMLELNLRNFMWVPAYSILIDGPAVRCLRVGNCDLGCITFPIDMTSLVKVDLCFRKCYAWEIENNKIKTFNDLLNRNNRTKGRCNLIKCFNCLRQIRCLKISSCEYLKVIDRVVGSIGKFNNLTKLELQVGVEWHLLVKFLEVADNLEVLIADVEIHNSCMEPKQVPKCLQSSLKTITIKQQGFEEHELDLVHYLSRNSQVLERMEILPPKDRPTSTSEKVSRQHSKCFRELHCLSEDPRHVSLPSFQIVE